MTNIEIVQVNPETGNAKKTQANHLHPNFQRDSLEELQTQSQSSFNIMKRQKSYQH